VIIEVMKSIKLDHALAEDVKNNKKHSTWRLFDDKDLSVNDEVVIIDKVDPRDKNSWVAIGEAKLTEVIEKYLGEISESDYEGHRPYSSVEEMLETFRGYYGGSVNLKTPVKVIKFVFTPYDSAKPIPVASPRPVTRVTETKLFTDGGSRGNPGPSASGFVLYDMNDQVLVDTGVYLGITTNNQAEYTALKLGLVEALALGVRKVHVFMDSMLVVNQMKGIFKIKNRDLWPVHTAIKDLVRQFDFVDFTHVPRELNKAADAAVNRALDESINASSSATE
jgi:ribonuclease HI